MTPSNTHNALSLDLLTVAGLALLIGTALRKDGPLTPDLQTALAQQTERLLGELETLADRAESLEKQIERT